MARRAPRRLLPLTIELSALTTRAAYRYLFGGPQTAKTRLNAEKIWAYVAGAALLFSAASAFV